MLASLGKSVAQKPGRRVSPTLDPCTGPGAVRPSWWLERVRAGGENKRNRGRNGHMESPARREEGHRGGAALGRRRPEPRQRVVRGEGM